MIDQAAAEAVAAAHAVHNVDAVAGGEVGLAAGIEHGSPVVVIGGDGGTEGDSNRFTAKLLLNLLCH